jgi:hypothetical protein
MITLETQALAVSRATNSWVLLRVAPNQPLLATDWLLYSGILLVSTGLIYWGVFRQLFRVLLFSYHWPVRRAEFFTTSLSLLMLLVIFGILLVFLLPQTVVTGAILSLLALLWIGHAITWAIS